MSELFEAVVEGFKWVLYGVAAVILWVVYRVWLKDILNDRERRAWDKKVFEGQKKTNESMKKSLKRQQGAKDKNANRSSYDLNEK